MAGVEIACHLDEIIFAFRHFSTVSVGGSCCSRRCAVGSTMLWITKSAVKKNCFCSLHLYYGYWIWFKRSWHQRVAQRFIIWEVQCISLWTQKRNVRNNIKKERNVSHVEKAGVCLCTSRSLYRLGVFSGATITHSIHLYISWTRSTTLVFNALVIL